MPGTFVTDDIHSIQQYRRRATLDWEPTAVQDARTARTSCHLRLSPSGPIVRRERPTMLNHRTMLVTNPQGLHLRVCAEIAKTVERYRATVTVRKGDQSENAASILGLLTLAAECGTRLVLFATGPEAEQAIQAIVTLFGDGVDGPANQSNSDPPACAVRNRLLDNRLPAASARPQTTRSGHAAAAGLGNQTGIGEDGR